MMKRFKNIGLFMVLVLFGSCAKEQMQEPVLGKNDVQIKLSVLGADKVAGRAAVEGTPQESKIHSLQLFFFNASSGQMEQEVNMNVDGATDITANQVWDAEKQILTLRNFNNLATERIVGVVVNTTVSGAIKSLADLQSAVSTTTVQPIAPPTTTSGVVMSGLSGRFKFSDTNNISIDLTRQVVKVKFTVKLALESAYPDLDFRVGQPKVRTLNAPNSSYYIGRDATPASNLVDIDYKTMTHEGDLWTLQMYLYENPTTGTATNQGTKFILSVPYAATDGKIVNHNYYLINLDNGNPTNSNKTLRNSFYDVTVTVKHLGSEIPAIDGTEIITKVKSWEGIEFNIPTDNINILELSNTSCDIYGDHADNILVGTVTVNREGVEGIAHVTYTGGNSSLASPESITLRYGVPVDLRINATGNFTNGKLTVQMVQETKEILITKQYDNSVVSIWANSVQSDAQWCGLSQRWDYIFGEQRQYINSTLGNIYAHISKASVGANATRMANLLCTTAATSTDVVKRVVVVQQPYIKNGSNTVAWASGNICLGHRPDGTECYVIGDAQSNGLWFFAGKSWGIRYNSAGSSAWGDDGRYYVPSGNGSNVSVSSFTNGDYGNLVSKATVEDPCKYVYTSDKSIRWRTPTASELQALVTTSVKDDNKGWSGGIRSGTNRTDIAYNTLDGNLYLKLTGRRRPNDDGSYFAGQVDNTSTSLSTIIGLWSNEVNPAYNLQHMAFYAIADFAGENFSQAVNIQGVFSSTALAVRCVRDITTK